MLQFPIYVDVLTKLIAPDLHTSALTNNISTLYCLHGVSAFTFTGIVFSSPYCNQRHKNHLWIQVPQARPALCTHGGSGRSPWQFVARGQTILPTPAVRA